MRLLIVDDDLDICLLLKKFLTKHKFEVETRHNAKEALDVLKKEKFDLVLTDFRLPDDTGVNLLQKIKVINPAIAVIIITGYSDVKIAVQAIKLGAFEYVTKPLHPDEILNTIKNALKMGSEKKPEQQRAIRRRFIQGRSADAQNIMQHVNLVAPTDMTVVIQGETGTGKEYVANSIHSKSARSKHPFIAIDCGALSKELAGSELFGHEKGAFTGATATRTGLVEAANNSTLFLDEIGDMPLHMQVKILRVLQERTFEKVGSNKTLAADVRVIAATHKDLEIMISDGSFREDLYYRLNVFPIEVPSLRERTEDVPLLINELISRMEKEKRGSIRFNSAAILSLCRHEWPGNVRELANLVERLAIMYPYGVVGVKELPAKFRYIDDAEEDLASLGEESNATLTDINAPAVLPVNGIDLKEFLAGLERDLIRQALDDAGGVVARAAEKLNIRRTTLVEKVRKYGLNAEA